MGTPKQEFKELSALQELKQAYDHGYASILVGAGFSMNVSSKLYVNWNELLSDLIWETENTSLEKAYQKYKATEKDDYLDIEAFRRKYIEDKIKEIGALEVASRYVHRCNDMHEAIDSYIEKHIPYAELNKDNSVSFYLEGKKIDTLSADCLYLHNLLLKCNRFNSFLTTNYDNLLELAALQSNLPIQIVKEGEQLTNVGKNSKIVKIHGSLSGRADVEGRFDGYDERYIITKEDYDDYEKKHNAFASTLRSEMLSNQICLIGFSGTDPNFRSCIDWLKRILISNNKKDPKFFLIDLFPNKKEDYWKSFYRNNFIKSIDLQDKSTEALLGISDSTHKPKDLLEALFNYLNNGNEDSLSLSNNHPIVDAKSLVYDYRLELEKIINLLYDKSQNIDILKILEIRKKVRFSKVIFPQEHIINYLTKKEPLTEGKAKLFALAVSDIGQIPSYYNFFFKDDIELNKQPIWTQLQARENTLRGSVKQLSAVNDASTYEQIQRYLFHLEFSKAKELVCKWNTTGCWIQPKAMRMAVYPELCDTAIDLLNKVIAKEENPMEKLFEVILANFISRQWPRPHSTDEFWKYGLEGQGDLLNSMMAALRGKEEKPKRRNWIGSTLHFGGNNGDYCKSLRILQFIIDSGIYLNLPGTYMFEIASWYRVFTNLYEHFPYPCFFYSIQYNDKDVLRRIGEDFAYNEGLLDFNQDILLKSLSANNNPDTPPSFKKGILNITAAMYIVVNEELWFERFIETVFKEFCKEIKSENNELFYNVKFAIGSLKNPKNIEIVLRKLLGMIQDNESVVADIIANSLMIDRLSTINKNDIDLHFSNYLSSDVLDILDTLRGANLLPTEIMQELIQVVRNSCVEEIPKNRVSLFQLTNLTCNDPEAIEKIKQRYLSMDIWHCGVLTGKEFGWTEPQYIRLNLLNDKVSWDDNQFETIKQNLIKNVSSYDKFHERLHEDSFLKTTHVKYLSDMLKFIDGLDEVRKSSLITVRDDVERLLAERTHYEDNIDLMMSDQSAEVDYAFSNIYESIQARGVEYCKHDLDFLIDRAIMKQPVALTPNLRYIKFIMNIKSEDILRAGYDKKLNKLLSIYMDSASWEFLDLRVAFSCLHSIAKKLDDVNLLNKDNAQFWLNNSFVKKFVID